MNVLDGYGMTDLPEPRKASQPYWPAEARVYADLRGSPWTVSEGALKEFRDGAWRSRYKAGPGETLLAAIPIRGRTLVLFADRLREFDPDRNTWRDVKSARDTGIAPFLTMATCERDVVWLTGERGLARIEPKLESSYSWTEISGEPQGLRGFIYPLPGSARELFAQARTASGFRMIVRWSGSRLEPVYTAATDGLRGWRGPDGAVWILEDASLFRLLDGRREPVDRIGALSGTVFDVYTENDRTFWIATSEGLARYTPSFWWVPPGLVFDQPVHAIAEDRLARLWFAATKYLLCLEGAAWKRYPLPPGMRTHTMQTDSLIPLADGRLMVKAVRGDQTYTTLFFDPKRKSFTQVLHPEGRRITLIVPRRAGGVWVVTEVAGVPGFHLEIFDGTGFRKVLSIGDEWKGANMRCVVERPDDDLWLGGSAGGILYHRGHFISAFDSRLGYTENGVFALGETRSSNTTTADGLSYVPAWIASAVS
jgi:ligand-binding sensor domain-containing protein